MFEWASDDPRPVGKLFSERPADAGVVGETLGGIGARLRVWDARNYVKMFSCSCPDRRRDGEEP